MAAEAVRAPPLRPASARARVALIVVAFLAATLPGLFDQPLERASQARAWVVARTMAESGDVVVPRYLGETRLKKPPLQSWVAAGVMRALGRTDVWVAGLATILVGLAFALGPWLLGRALGAADAGFLGSLLLCASRATTTWGNSPEHDVPFAAFVGLSWVALARALSPTGRARDVALSGLACGAALLTKDPFAVAFVAGTALVLRARASTRGPVSGPRFWPLWAFATLAPIALWLGAVVLRLGSVGAVFDEAWRQASGAQRSHARPFPGALVFYAGTLPKFLLPWSPIAIAVAAIAAIRARRGLPSIGAPARFAVVASVVALVVLTLAPAKQEHYVVPLLVPAALLGGHVLLETARAAPGAGRAVVWSIVGIAIAYAASRFVSAGDPRGDASGSLGFLIALVSWGALAFLVLLRRPRPAPIVAAALVGVVAMGFGSLADVVHGRAVEDYRDAAARSGWSRDPRVPVVGYERGPGEAFDTFVAWLPNPYERVSDRGELDARLARGDRVHVVMRAATEPSLGDVAGLLTGRIEIAPRNAKSARDRYLGFDR